MPYKNKADANAAARRRWVEDPSVRARHKVAQDKWEAEHQDERNVEQAKWAKDHRFKNYADAREYEFAREMKKYNTTVEWYRDKLIEQLGVCALCGHLNYFRGKLQRLQVDHDHACCDKNARSCGKCLRGLLCSECNITISYIEKWIGVKMDSALAYLNKF